MSLLHTETRCLQANPIALLRSRALILTLLCLVVLETAVRLIAPDGLKPKGGYRNSEIRQQLQQFHKVENLDLLIVGSSIAAVNFPPESIDQKLSNEGSRAFTSFNSGIRGCNYSCILEGIRHYYLPHAKPRYALLVVGTVDIDYSNKTVVQRSEKFIESIEQPSHRLWFRNIASSLSWVYGLDDEIRAYIVNQRWIVDSAKVTVRGHIDMGSDPRRRFPDDPQFDRESDSIQALTELIDLLKKHGVTVTLLPALGDSQGRAKLKVSTKQKFHDLIRQIAAQEKVHYLQFAPGYMPDDYYIDDIHMHHEAALKHGEYVADKLMDAGSLGALDSPFSEATADHK